MRTKAAHLGHAVRSEDGVDRAVSVFHDLEARLGTA
jgi:hypothetical protein